MSMNPDPHLPLPPLQPLPVAPDVSVVAELDVRVCTPWTLVVSG